LAEEVDWLTQQLEVEGLFSKTKKQVKLISKGYCVDIIILRLNIKVSQ